MARHAFDRSVIVCMLQYVGWLCVCTCVPLTMYTCAVERLLCKVIVEKVAHGTEVLSEFVPACCSDTLRRDWLSKLTLEAHHLLYCVSAAAQNPQFCCEICKFPENELIVL